jgi:dienelactone hydrolase
MTVSALRRLLVTAALLPLACCSDDASPGPDATLDAQTPTDAEMPRRDASSMRDASPGDASGLVGGPLDSGESDAGTPGQGPSVDRRDPKLRELALDPHVLDPSTKDSLSTQYAQLDTRSAPLGKLVIFLPGATNVPRDWRDHGRKLAEFGFHVLIPHYNNRWSGDGTCTGKGSGCADNTRWEALVGEDTSTAIAIARADSAEGRVITMLTKLRSEEPEGDWGYYLTSDGALRYERAIIAGISHGAASAGMYAARRPFTRNVMHSSGAAGSASASKMTPASEWYGFAHQQDDAYTAIIASWNSFALPGQPTSIDDHTPPFASSHRLTTNASSTYPHGSTCAHSSSPKDASGNYLFEPAWRYLYGAPAK